MTNSTKTERAELVALADRLTKQTQLEINDLNAVRNYLDADSELHHEVAFALRRLASQDQKPPPATGLDEFKPTQEQINSACMSYRHDFGLLDAETKDGIRFQAGEWLSVWQKEFAYALRTTPAATKSADAVGGWRSLSEDTSWIDGRDVVLLARDMEVQARYCPGEWSDETPNSPREYSGAVWSCFDDEFQLEIEECSHDPSEWGHDGATHWRPVAALPHQPAPVAANASAEDYRNAIDEALVVRYLGVAKGNAKSELDQIISWEVDANLDPAVSSRAQALIDQGRNASAEARLREALGRELSGNSGQLLENIAAAIRGDGSDLCDGDWVSLSEDQKECWRGDANRVLAAIKEYLTTTPRSHASDCDKQGETGMNWSVRDETLRRIEEVNENRRNAAINANSIVAGSPSDHPADVTVDDLAVVLANARRAAHGSAPMTKEEAGYVHLWSDGSESKTQARALLDAFTVGRR